MKPVRIVHTADNHIGLKFNSRSYPVDLKGKLVQERFDALGRVVTEANAWKADLLVVAGDLFDNLRVQKSDIRKTAELLNGFAGSQVVVLPGNHDFFEPGNDTLWARFAEAMSQNFLTLLSTPQPVSVPVGDVDVTFFPGPCASKHSPVHAIGWIAPAQKNPESLNIGVAHGSVAGVSPDKDDRYFPMTAQDLQNAGVDFWLLGHTHVRFPAHPTAEGSLFYIPSTHTPDGFDCDHEGFIWCLEVDAQKHVTMKSVRTGAYRFHEWQREVTSASSLDDLSRELDGLDPDTTLLKLVLSGRLSEEGFSRLRAWKENIVGRFCYSEIYDGDVALNINRDYIDAHFSKDSLPHRLLSALARDPNDNLALQLAHELVQEAKQ